MTGYTSCAESAAKIRSAYKARGWNSRQISVRADTYSMGSSVRIEIKDGSIPLHVARSLADGQERIRRDEHSGEILSGGNRFVFVELSDQARAFKAAPYVAAVVRAMAEFGDPVKAAEDDRRTHVDIVPGYTLGADTNGAFGLWSPRQHISQHWNSAGVSNQIAVQIALDAESLIPGPVA